LEGKKETIEQTICGQCIAGHENDIPYLGFFKGYSNGISILVYQFHYLRDTPFLYLKQAINMVESGRYDALMLYDEEVFISNLSRTFILAYCKLYGIPVIMLKDRFYQ